jgi:hypothetical protein
MRRNRKRRLHSRLMPPAVAGGIVLLATLAVAYLVMDHKCSQYGQQIKEFEQRYVALENEQIREESRWNVMKTPEQIEAMLLRHGLLMVYARPEQVVRMGRVPLAPAPAIAKTAYRERDSGVAVNLAPGRDAGRKAVR